MLLFAHALADCAGERFEPDDDGPPAAFSPARFLTRDADAWPADAGGDAFRLFSARKMRRSFLALVAYKIAAIAALIEGRSTSTT